MQGLAPAENKKSLNSYIPSLDCKSHKPLHIVNWNTSEVPLSCLNLFHRGVEWTALG